MRHQGMILLDDLDDGSWERGVVTVDADEIAISVGQADVGHWPVVEMAITEETVGRYWLSVNTGRVLFAPDDTAAFEDEVRAQQLRTRLGQRAASPPRTVARPQPNAPTRAVASPKSPGVAAVLSALWTGLGQIYNGEIALGVVLMFVQVVNALLVFVLIGFITGPIVWIIGIVQAYRGAERYNQARGLIV